MECISELKDSLNVYFGWNKAKMACFVNMLLALLATRTVNLNKLACVVFGDALFYGLKPNEQRCLKGRRFVWGHLVYLAGLRLVDGELLIVATTELPETAIDFFLFLT